MVLPPFPKLAPHPGLDYGRFIHIMATVGEGVQQQSPPFNVFLADFLLLIVADFPLVYDAVVAAVGGGMQQHPSLLLQQQRYSATTANTTAEGKHKT